MKQNWHCSELRLIVTREMLWRQVAVGGEWKSGSDSHRDDDDDRAESE